jgi:enamine deaminase RidA (YjgF/YER057c/UK114 family)
MIDEVLVPGWPTPKGYANGRAAAGRTVHVGGQIGWTAAGVFEATDLVGQFAQTLDNVIAVVRAAGGQADDIASMTVFVTDMAAYRSARNQLGPVWKQRFGRYYPAMALVAVTALFEPQAVVEIQAIAHVLP